MQLPAGLLLLTIALLLNDAYCDPTEGPNSIEEAAALANANAEAGSQTGNHLGDVSVNNGDETKAEVQTSDLHQNGIEAAAQEIEADIQNGDVQPTGNVVDVIMELAKEYDNGTRKGEPSVFHSPLEAGVDNSTEDSTGRRIEKRQAYPYSNRWVNGIVPYTFSDVRSGQQAVPASGQEEIKKAMKFYEATTCLRFPLWTSTVHAENNLAHTAFLRFIVPDDGGCWSVVGQGGNDGQPISCCNSYGVALHEIGHALGLLHEQDRSNRDQFVEQHPENAVPNHVGTFSGTPYTSGVDVHPYDYGSMMHYGLYFFSGNGEPTLTISNPDDAFLLGNSENDISHYDLMGISNYYECAKSCPDDKKALKCQNDGFVDVHCKCKCSALFTGDLCEKLYTPPDVPAWPTGSYGLPDSVGGCPTTGTWSTGSRTQALEWGSKQDNGYLKPFSGTTVSDHFCMKSDATSGSGDWPAGTYCIYQQGDSCPTGFQSGFILFDNDNTRGATDNAVTGSVPKGVYDENTKYFYCCRGDGSYSKRIKLPMDKPFHLLRHGGECQNVGGMLNTAYYARYDLEDTSPVLASSDPKPSYAGWWNDVWMYYCYYKPINYGGCGSIIDLTDANPSVNISSPNYPDNYNDLQECTWYIKGPTGKHLAMDFYDFDLEEDSNKNCKDSVEIRSTLPGQPGEKYCGKGFKRTTISPAGFLVMTLRTGYSGTRKGFSATVRIISDSEQCINTEDSGKSYRGNVDYTQHYDKCIPWDQAQHCAVNAFSHKYIFSGLAGHSKCRNPNNMLRPWCYINKFCEYGLCEVCGIAQCYDFHEDCAELVVTDSKLCSTEKGFKGCHKSCNLCGAGYGKPVSSCAAPVVKDKNAVIEPAKASQTTFTLGEKVKLECKKKVNNVKVTSKLMCTTDGKYEGMEMFCGIECPEGWSRFRENCYRFTETKLHYPEAIEACKAENAVMTGIADASENEFVRQLVGGTSGWIGYNDIEKNDQWDWVDGVKRNYTNWKPNEPSLGNERCTIIGKDGAWNDIYCYWHYPQRSVCKKPHQEYDSDYYCVDEGPNCFELISRNYKLCKGYRSYGFAHCRRSCGLCPVMECANPGLVSNTVQKVTDNYITSGDYFEYDCSSGHELASGNLGRTCLRNGTITGSAPLCKPEAEFEDTFGQRVIPRAKTEGKHKLTVYDSQETNINREGKALRWEVYSTITTTLMAQVWGQDNDTFILIGQTLLTLRPKRVNSYTLKSFEGYHVKSGYRLGWYTPRSQGMQYSDCPDAYANRTIYQSTVTNMDEVRVGMQKTIPLVDKCRTYSIALTVGGGGIGTYTNVAAASRGATCVDASSNKEICGLAIDGGLMPYNNAWMTNPTNGKSVGSFIKIKFDGSYSLVGAKFMQRLSKSGQNQKLTLTFSDGSTQEVGLLEGQGTSAMDTTAAVWNAFDLTPVVSNSVKVTVDTVYSTDQNGFIEIEFYAGCPEGWTLHKESCYKKEDTSMNWLDAEKVCQETSNAHHVSISSEEENTFVKGLLTAEAWLGFNDRNAEGNWTWTDGADNSFTKWSGSGPDNWNNEDCAQINTAGIWGDIDCGSSRPYVCERPIDNAKQVSQTALGNPVQPREKVDGSSHKGYIYLEGSSALTVPKSGSIKAWKLYSDSDYDVTMMVLRPLADKYTLVGENTVSIKGKTTNLISINSFNRIQVQEGDLIAWYYLPGKNPGIPYDVCSSSTQKAKWIKHPTSEPLMVGQPLTATVPGNPCRTYSISYFMTDEQPAFENVAALTALATCSGDSAKQGTCGMVLDGLLTDWDGSWVPASPPTGQFFDVQLAEAYSVVGGRIMQRMSATAQIKTIKLEFGDGTIKEVTLRKRQGSGDGDFSAQMWDTFSLDQSVDTNSVKLTITDLYPQSKADSKVGITEFQIVANGCPVNWTRHNDNCYRKDSTKDFYAIKEAACQTWGAHVSSVKDQAENDFLVKLAGSSVYLGYTWDRAGTKWVSADGSTMIYTNWKDGQPDGVNNSEYCIIIDTDGKWGDLYCQWHYAQPVICKKGIKRIAPARTVGEAAEPRKWTSADARIHIPIRSEFRFTQAGRITAWKVFGLKKSVTVLSVYRQDLTVPAKFTLIGSNTIETEEGKMSYIKVPEDFQINVLANDYIGLQSPRGDVGIPWDPCSESGVDTYEIKNGWSSPEPGQSLTLTSMLSWNYYPCRKYSVNAIVEEVKEQPAPMNIASAGLGATCEASDNAANCGKVIDEDTSPSSDWEVTASPVAGNWIKITFKEAYPVQALSIMQRFGADGQSKDITLEFSDSTSQTVTLKQRLAGSATDARSGFWDDFVIDKVDTTFIKFTITNAYSESENGFVEIKVYSNCPVNWTRHNDNCYRKDSTRDFYAIKEAACQAWGAHVSSVRDQAENDFIMKLAGSSVYLGYTWHRDGTKWVSADGSNMTYTNWKAGQPDGVNNSEYCIYLDTSGKWGDLYCQWHYAQPVICKKGITKKMLRDAPDVTSLSMDDDSDQGDAVLNAQNEKRAGRLARIMERSNKMPSV